ncbi:M10 family metallopeptidase C-terminal domain-containing protein [Methylorubrum extorquens]
MYVASDLSFIAHNNGLNGVAGVDAAVGAPLSKAQLKSFSTLKATDGVYYNKAMNTLVITKSGVTLDGYDFRGVSINVQADNITIKNSTFDAAVGNYAINAMPGTKNLTVDHSTFDGLKLDKISYNVFVSSRGENTVLTNNAFLDAPADAVQIQSGTISGNYFAGGAYAKGAHADAIWIGKTIGPVVISGNVIDWRSRADAPTETNEAVRISGELGNVSNVLVKNNILLGGSMTVMVTDGATQTHTTGQVGTVTGVKVVENVIDFGKYGDLEQTYRPKDMVYADNMHASGRPVTPGLEAVGTLPDLSTLNKITTASASAAIKGTAKGDYILGGSGSNYIEGGSGNDVIVGGGGRDIISGGGGEDIFVYQSLTNDGIDRISDFTQGQDRIDLSTITGAPKALADWQWLGSESFTGNTWQVRYKQSSGVTTIELDADGDLKADFKLELTGKHALKTSDFILAEKGPDLPTAPAPSAPTAPPVSSTPTQPAEPAPPASAPTAPPVSSIPTQPAEPAPPASAPTAPPVSSTPTQPAEPAPPASAPTAPPVSSTPAKPAEPAPPAQSADPSLVLHASASGGYVTGKAAAELIMGSSKFDGLRGGAGDDVLVGGGGKDILYGEAGRDTFRFEKLSDSTANTAGRDYIGDFVKGEDKIDLHLIDANALTAAHDAFTWIGSGTFTKHAGELRFASITGGATVQADVDGDGKVDFAIDVMTKMALQSSDFILAEKGPDLPTAPAPSAPTAPPVSSTPTQPAEPAPPAQSADPSLVLHASASGGYVTGKAAAELIMGSSKFDGLRGGAGDDVLVGGGGKDILYGEAGRDTFRFEKLSDSTANTAGRDYIGDFVKGEDKIDLHLIDANALTAAHDAFTWIGSGTFTKHAGELRFASITGGATVQADVDGDGKVDFAIDVMTKMALQSSDFIL